MSDTQLYTQANSVLVEKLNDPEMQAATLRMMVTIGSVHLAFPEEVISALAGLLRGRNPYSEEVLGNIVQCLGFNAGRSEEALDVLYELCPMLPSPVNGAAAYYVAIASPTKGMILLNRAIQSHDYRDWNMVLHALCKVGKGWIEFNRWIASKFHSSNLGEVKLAVEAYGVVNQGAVALNVAETAALVSLPLRMVPPCFWCWRETKPRIIQEPEIPSSYVPVSICEPYHR